MNRLRMVMVTEDDNRQTAIVSLLAVRKRGKPARWRLTVELPAENIVLHYPQDMVRIFEIVPGDAIPYQGLLLDESQSSDLQDALIGALDEKEV